jgi:dihydroneopterin aldolase
LKGYRRVINLAIYASLRKAGQSDRFEDTVDYRAIKKRIVSMAENSWYYLVKAMVEAIAEICLDHPAVTKVQVRVDKPGPCALPEVWGWRLRGSEGKRWRERSLA